MNHDSRDNRALESEITFSKRDTKGIHQYNNDLMVITITYDDWEIKRMSIDQGRYVDILYWDAFERLRLDLDDLKAF